MMLKPAWIDNLPNEIQECSVSDLMMLILDKVAIGMIGLLEGMANGMIVDPLNAILRPIKNTKIGWKTNVLGADIGFELKPFDFINLIKRACIPYKDIKDCKSDKEQAELAALLGCSFDDKSLWKRCYYERVRPARRTRLRAPQLHAYPLRGRSSPSAWRTTTWSTGTRTSLRVPAPRSCRRSSIRLSATPLTA